MMQRWSYCRYMLSLFLSPILILRNDFSLIPFLLCLMDSLDLPKKSLACYGLVGESRETDHAQKKSVAFCRKRFIGTVRRILLPTRVILLIHQAEVHLRCWDYSGLMILMPSIFDQHRYDDYSKKIYSQSTFQLQVIDYPGTVKGGI